MNNFNITLFEACELLNRSKKSISRYIRRGLLHPRRVKSQQGTLEYRFSKADIEAFKTQEALKADEPRQDGTDETDQTGHKEPIKKTEFIENKEIKGQIDETGQDTPDKPRQDRTRETGQGNEVITLLKETTGFLRDQLKTKDEQISSLGGKIDQLIERDRETNIILKGLQDKVLMLEQPKAGEKQGKQSKIIKAQTAKSEQTRQDTGDKTGQGKANDKRLNPEKSFWKEKDFWKKVLNIND